MMTANMRVIPPPAYLPVQRPRDSESPVYRRPAPSTKTAAMTIAGSLWKPASASSGLKMPVSARARMMSRAIMSVRSFSVINNPMATARIAKKTSWCSGSCEADSTNGCTGRNPATVANKLSIGVYLDLSQMGWCAALRRGAKVVGHIGDDHAGVEEQAGLQPQGGLVVQQVLPPVARHVLRQQDDQRVVGVTLVDRVDVRQQRSLERAEW